MILSLLKRYDWYMVGAAISLAALGLISQFNIARGDYNFFEHQFLWIMLGIVLFVAISAIDYRIFRHYSLPVLVIYILGAILLTTVLIVGSAIRGAQSWLVIGPLVITPIEFVKLTLVLLLAKYFAMRHIEIYRFRHIIVSGLYAAVPSFLVILQPELGSFIIIVSIWIGVMLVAGINYKQIVILIISAIVLISLAWSFGLHDYQRARVLTFLDPTKDPHGNGYNAIQSITAVGSGGWLGQGAGHGTQTQFGFLPEMHTDFIFAAISEEFGVIGAGLVLFLFALLIWRIIQLAKNSPNNFARLTSMGFAMMLFSQSFVNIGMNVGVMPITGIPLPFVSYGGSSIVSSFIALGFLQSIFMRSHSFFSYATIAE
ncbi:MAG: rod shape-determining protein RodA [Candidatus Spechtbacteria bacterium]|nr:rod shape-determining protein RodA [Candidatus Spechtbacteria bacterium]